MEMQLVVPASRAKARQNFTIEFPHWLYFARALYFLRMLVNSIRRKLVPQGDGFPIKVTLCAGKVTLLREFAGERVNSVNTPATGRTKFRAQTRAIDG
jgi:hypothetical protein